MKSDLLRRLDNLRATLADGDITEADYERAIDRLRIKFGNIVNQLLSQDNSPSQESRTHTLAIAEGAYTNVAVAGDVRGNIYINGRREKSASELIQDYLERLHRRCQNLPLQGIYEQRTTTDRLDIALDRVYTQLTTKELSAYERFECAELQHFNAAAFLAEHTGAHLMPDKLRLTLRCEFTPNVYRERPEGRLGAAAATLNLDNINANDLAVLSREASALIFFGSQLAAKAIVDHERLVLLGDPGSGKSTMLRYIALILAAAGLDERVDIAKYLYGWTLGRLLPIFVPLLPLAKRFITDPGRAGNAEDVWNYVVDHLVPKGGDPALAIAIHNEIEQGNGILLLDGLDEVVGTASRRKVVNAIYSFAEQYPRCRIVVTCRIRAYEGERNWEWQLPGWPSAILANWTIGQMKAFVRAWYSTVAEQRSRSAEWRDERITDLTQAIEVRDDLQRLGRSPLMITIMALVHLNERRLPQERVTLYSRCIDILLGQWEIAGKDATEYGTLMDYIGMGNAGVQTLRPVLGRAAYEAHCATTTGEIGRISRSVLRTLVDDELKRRGHANPSQGADRFLEYTDQRAGLLQASDVGDDYVFPHQTFHEYLAGLELVGGTDAVARMMNLRGDDRWRKPILLGVAHLALSSLDIPYRLLAHLIEEPGRGSKQCAYDLLLAVEIAADIGWRVLEQRDLLFAGLRARLVQALTGILSEQAVSARLRVQAGEALSALGDPRPGVCTLPPTMVALPGGSFVIGNTFEQAAEAGKAYEAYFRSLGDLHTAAMARHWPEDEINDRPVQVAPFWIAHYPVTNAQYELFINAGGYDPVAPWWDDAGRTWLARDDTLIEGLEPGQRRSTKHRPEWWEHPRLGAVYPNHPVLGVSWYEAVAFCRWLTCYLNDGYLYRLPSEVEWEYAARDSEYRLYPWGNNEPDGEHANYDGQYYVTTAVGCFPMGATSEGVYDLAGNVWEWTSTVYAAYPYDSTDGRENPDKPSQKQFTLRGGGWCNNLVNLRAVGRNHHFPDHATDRLGFRLVRHIPQAKG